MSIRYPQLVTKHIEVCHPTLELRMTEGFVGPLEQYCGYSWCRGECGYAALVLTDDSGMESKVYSSMTAYGPVVQPWRREWKGSKVELPKEFHDDFKKRYWI